MLAGFLRLSIGIMWHVEVIAPRCIYPVLRDVVVAGVGCVLYCVGLYARTPAKL
jgi:hypothetical protein